MSKWSIRIGFSTTTIGNIELSDDISPKKLADALINMGHIDETEIGEDVYIIPDKETGGVCLVDDSGYPYATLIKMQENTIGEVASAEKQSVSSNVPKCPTCGSTKLIKQTVMSRGISGLVFGRLSVEGRAQWACKDCGYMW